MSTHEITDGAAAPRHHRARHYSEEGDAILRQGYPEGIAVSELLVAVNACLPDGALPLSEYGIVHRVRTLKIHRAPEFRAQESVRQRIRCLQERLDGIYEPRRPPPRRLNEQTNRDEASDRQKPLALRRCRCPCDRDTALAWGQRWANSSDLGVINDARVRHQLPEFIVR